MISDWKNRNYFYQYVVPVAESIRRRQRVRRGHQATGRGVLGASGRGRGKRPYHLIRSYCIRPFQQVFSQVSQSVDVHTSPS
jgi:hypothetical protein